jgi:type IV pilus assembly protein PilE
MKRCAQGFSLIEVLVVLALMGLLTQIAWPRFDAHLQRVHRTQVQQALMELAQRLSMQHSWTGRFAQSTRDRGDDVNDQWLEQNGWDRWPTNAALSDARYRIRFVASAAQAHGFTLLAEPVGAQSQDSCGVLMLDQRHVRGAQGVLDSRAEQTRRCWSR